MSNLRNNWRSFLNYSLPRMAITVLIYIFLFNNVKDASYIIGNIDFGYGRITAGWSLVVASAFIVIVIWLTYDVLVSIASSLGYRGGDSRGFVINGNTGVINLPSGDRAANRDFNNKQKFQIIQYEAGKPLFALSQARERIHYHIDRLQNSSIVNLFIGIAIAFIGIGTIGSTFFEIEKYADKNSGFNTTGFLVFALLPRLSIALIVQVFSFFFLMMYRSNVSDIRYFQNEITNIDSISAAIACLRGDADASTKSVISALLKTERNRLASKNQKVINPSNDEDVMVRLSAIEGKLAGQKAGAAKSGVSD